MFEPKDVQTHVEEMLKKIESYLSYVDENKRAYYLSKLSTAILQRAGKEAIK